VDLFNKNINDIYKDMGFKTFRDIEITKEVTRGRLTSLDVKVEHASGKTQSLSSLSKAEQLTLGLVFKVDHGVPVRQGGICSRLQTGASKRAGRSFDRVRF
jgi:hypothetical protein